MPLTDTALPKAPVAAVAVPGAPDTAGLDDRLAAHLAGRLAHPDVPRLKINLYRGYEVAAVAEAAADLRGTVPGFTQLDSLMVADSVLTTHMGRASTRVPSGEEAAFLDIMRGLVAEVAAAARAAFGTGPEAPYVIADMPDGSARTPDDAERHGAGMLALGADILKVEVGDDGGFPILERLGRAGLPVIAHLGYTPQSRENRKYGTTPEEALALCAAARRARDAGARAIVLERVSGAVNGVLSRPSPRGLPVYSIFSGRCPHLGQSLNVWDSVIRPDFAAKAFPPTADLNRAAYPDGYTGAAIRAHMAALLRLTLEGRFPPRDPLAPPAGLPDDPWGAA
ncbi:3-methyl-2-oxobutanoate hydroxymethyltransferase [Roseospira visakhapatnamensis]|uniref:3-methyl-2-oxobutanoate hydroxymethyltransferase n=1 Tax=Roseospira visakhapatnamensis TaxID=390880 RepID=A0A7W6RB98_9PROT|nr:3-methyl-2-oxobutanoate hydroxymethyltransferase [Roseospira visakhapatnamensis]MBB4264749.1 ketopantoate hydroxymethyltransferase [Roseospira visakhapatnamensis]